MSLTPHDGCKALYVGNLDPRVTEEMLQQIFSVVAPVGNVKIIRDRNYSHGGFNYGFVEFNDHAAAEQAMQALSGRSVFGHEIRVNWAAQGSAQKEDTANHYHIFVGDLSPEVTDEVLGSAFTLFRSMSEARVMWDQSTGKSRGFGFVAFRERQDAEQAIATMNGEWLGSRAIRCNWANQKNTSSSSGNGGSSGGMGSGSGSAASASNPYPISPNMTYEQIFAQTPPYHTTVYIGNLPHGITQQDIAPFFQQYGYVSDIRLQTERGFAFIKMDSHTNAANAIYSLQGYQIHGRPAKLSWGKDRVSGSTNAHLAPGGGAAGSPAGAVPYDPYSTYGSYPAAAGYAPSAAGAAPGTTNWVQPGSYDARGVGNAGMDGSAGWTQQQQQQYYQQYYSAGHNI
ncbi:hypothetical protein BX666DRAFT_1938095 [Dichotomocladium elegans]|nr:hypothetical protein BX666DRAFT_1938095 [Dichotomocladium elegans]